MLKMLKIRTTNYEYIGKYHVELTFEQMCSIFFLDMQLNMIIYNKWVI